MQPHRGQQSAANASRTALAVQALSAGLSNPYAQHFTYSSHYAAAYAQAQNYTLTTPEGYTLSSTYTPGSHNATSTPLPAFNGSRDAGPSRPNTYGRPGNQGNWYQPGNSRCDYPKCTFTGSAKSLEIHKMDRHLIYPPGWERRKRKPDWDADPSLKNGKPIPIQGTSVVFKTQEDIDNWLAERRKKWPTVTRTEEKEKKLQEAIERGDLPPINQPFARKRQRTDEPQHSGGFRGASRGRGRGRGRGGGGGGGGSYGAGRPTMVHALPPRPASLPPKPSGPVLNQNTEDTSLSDSDSGSDMDPEDAVSSKVPVEPLGRPQASDNHDMSPSSISEKTEDGAAQAEPGSTEEDKERTNVPPMTHRPPPRPKVPPPNLFSNRDSLLRNLLLPEIRATVSNFSQAIHFLVANDFLEGVELKPGEAENRPITVIGEGTDAEASGS